MSSEGRAIVGEQVCARGGSHVRAPSVAWCVVMILMVKVTLRLVGFARTVAIVRAMTAHSESTTAVGRSLLHTAERSVAMAAALFPGRALCLEQSLTLYLVLRRRGVSVRFRLGAQPHPFEAHAWIEYKGEPLNDIAEHVDFYAPLPDVLP